MAIQAKSMATKIDTEAGTVTFSMLNRNDVAVVEHTMPLEAALSVFSFVLQAMDDAGLLDDIDEDDDDDEVEEIAGHC